MNADPRKNPGIKRPYLPLPAVTAPAGEICITIPIPDHPDHKRALLSVLHLLESWHSWERTGTDEGAQAAAVWREKLNRIDWDGGNCSSGEFEQDCIDFTPAASFITFEPQNPYTEPDYVPDGYLGAPFTIVEAGDTYNTYQYLEVGDIVCKAPPITAGLDYPRFRVTVSGEREIELHLLTLFTGGSVLITQDDDPFSAEVIDLYRDQTAVPPESAVEIVIERQVTGAGEHHIDVTFTPLIDTELVPVGFGGGLRKVTICGEEDMTFDVRQDPLHPLILQKTNDSGETWVDFAELPPQTRVRQTIIEPCVLEYSLTGGIGDEAWEPFANLQLCPPKIRWRGGILEWFDGDGDEWVPFEILDPLYDNPPPPNPRPEEAPNDPRCSAAASATYAYMDLANRLFGILDQPLVPLAFSAAASMAGVASDVLNFFHGSDFFTNLSANAAFQLNTLAYLNGLYAAAGLHSVTPAAELADALDLTNPDTRDKIKCALYCAMSDTGVVSSADAFDALDTAIADDGLAPGWSSFTQLFGAGGVAAASSVGAFSVPASDCDCDCPECDLEFVPSAEQMAQTSCTSGTNYLFFDSEGAYSTIPFPYTIGAYIDLAELLPLSGGDTGWKIKWDTSITLEGVGVAEDISMTGFPPCETGSINLGDNGAVWNNVDADHHYAIWVWQGNGGVGRISHICIARRQD